MNGKMLRTPAPGEVPGRKGLDAVRKPLALMGASCLFLSTIEYMIPKPLPFMRLGIANLPLLLGLDMFPFPVFLLLAVVKIIGQALITGTLFSYVFLFSLAGTFLSALSMYGLRAALGRKRIGFVGTSAFGAMVSTISQLVLARFFVFGEAALYMAPLLLAAGMVTGAGLGLFAEFFAEKSTWFAKYRLAR